MPASRPTLGGMGTHTGGGAERDHARIAEAIAFLGERWRERPSPAELAERAGLSRFHFQRLFRDWAGIPPARFTQLFALREAREMLERGASVLDASLGAGQSGPGRLHDLFVKLTAVTPGEHKRGGAGVEITWGLHPTPLGTCLVARTARGVCRVSFVEASEHAAPELAAAWPGAALRRDDVATGPDAARLFDASGEPVALHVRGTSFQVQVWSALLRVPPGAATSYGALARAVGRPTAARAVGRAVAENPVAIWIPCHRVLRASGALGGYRWGETRKRALLGRELGYSFPSGWQARQAGDE